LDHRPGRREVVGGAPPDQGDDVEPAGARLLLQQDVVEEAGLLPEQGVRAAHVPPELLPRGVGHRELVHAIDGRHGKPPWVGAGARGPLAGPDPEPLPTPAPSAGLRSSTWSGTARGPHRGRTGCRDRTGATPGRTGTATWAVPDGSRPGPPRKAFRCGGLGTLLLRLPPDGPGAAVPGITGDCPLFRTGRAARGPRTSRGVPPRGPPRTTDRPGQPTAPHDRPAETQEAPHRGRRRHRSRRDPRH